MGTRTTLKRAGAITEAERNFVAQLVLDQPRELTGSQIHGLTKVLRRSKEAVKSLIEDAQAKFRENAEFYVDAHRASVQRALASGTIAGLEVAQKGSQWAIERTSADGARIIEKSNVDAGLTGPRVMIGIQVGGLDATKAQPVIDVTATEV
jgi:hypothetical protein